MAGTGESLALTCLRKSRYIVTVAHFLDFSLNHPACDVSIGGFSVLGLQVQW